jgi:hypothetical protein
MGGSVFFVCRCVVTVMLFYYRYRYLKSATARYSLLEKYEADVEYKLTCINIC